MLEIAGKRNPVKTNWVNRVCEAVKSNEELRDRFGIPRMDEFRAFVRRQNFGAVKGAAIALESGATPVLLYRWQREQSRDERRDGTSSRPTRPAKQSAQPDEQLHMLPFWAGVQGLRF